ncbi:protein-glucosylgalactosylhydroxylysine glucosidase isoform X3 [Odocoileus virginianus]|uniref:Protein-glucosylgalactosylhydroxylysine glucosidase n=1 Tax=Odocoileus virginianus TaxID=9874 RepID=A0A6J0Z3J4_ODOVR|nr:protein-glucosylgalactosylhydroxylysine glucosidase isoform X2 [Odocoileus virginianus texanus]
MEDAGKDATRFTAHSLPSDPRLLATVTNAYLGTRVYHETLHVSGVYNGALGDTHRAILPSPLNVQLAAPAGTGEQLTKTYVLDTNTGSFLHTLEGPSFRASQRIYAHRTLPHVLAFSVSLTRLAKGSWPVTVRLQSAFSPESPDLDLHLGPDFQGARYLYGRTLTPEQPGGAQQEVHVLWTPVPPALTLGEGQEDATWEFLTVVGGSQAEAQACLAEALQLQARHALYTAHAQAWAQLWADCGLDVEGPLALRQALRGSLYYLLSALPQPGAPGYVCHGLSPGGLSNGSRGECYWGHVFWDQDLWVLPGLLLLHPEAAKALLQYRIRTLSGALDNARSLGYQGAKFAWESAGSGLEVCPEAIYGTQEIHVNGAVVLAFQLYYHATQDLELFREAGGWDVVRAVAEFWCSRVEWSPEEKKYHLKGVMPPDEYHPGVNNSVYTNVLVQNRQNLEIYEAVTSPHGPAMTWSMFAVGWMELKDPGRAWALLEKSFANVTEPFKVWTENADGSGAVNFLTGMGGFLQAVLFGVTGFRITAAGLTFDPTCPVGVSGVCVSGISYQGSRLNFSLSAGFVTVEVTAQAGRWAPSLEAELWPSRTRLPLPPGRRVCFPCSAGRIQRSGL